jgi:hypothetical protein
MRTHRSADDLFGRIANFNALRVAAAKAMRGKRKKPGASAFFASREREFLRLEHQLNEGSYRPGRYVEILVRDAAVLADWRNRIDHYLEGRRLKLHPRKTVILPTAQPVQFLGFVLYPGGRRLPEDNVSRFRNRLRGLRDRWRAGKVTRAEAEARIGAWIAHASHADTFNLRRALFKGTRFEPWPGAV